VDESLTLTFIIEPCIRWYITYRLSYRDLVAMMAEPTGFKSFANASITISGIEPAYRIHKRQFSFASGRRRRGWSLKQQWDRALA
jgi:transposase-like protein